MEKFSSSDINNIFIGANKYFTKKFPDGVSLTEIKSIETDALKKYLKVYIKNLQYGKTRYNTEERRLRNEWFLLESIENIMTINQMEQAKDLSFCIDSKAQINMFSEYIKQNEYSSYSDEFDKEII